jgi:AAA ATPase domain
MQQLFERRYRDAEQGLHVRIGLGAGEATVTDGDYFGMPTVEAARLCAHAPADGVLISATVKLLAGRCDGVEFSSAGELELKGFPEPVQAFSVSWAPLSDEAREADEVGRWPLPASLRSVPPVAYVGRIEERAALEEAMTLARAGQRQIVLLSGEPGIGKTRLSSYAADRAHAQGIAVCWGACSEELAVPYEPWIEVCSQLVEHAPIDLLAAHVERHGGELSRVARNLRERVTQLPGLQSSDPETERYLLFSAVAGLIGEVAEQVPVCVVLDDLHWADAQSIALLKHLLRTLEQGSLQLIATFRDSDLGKDHPLTAVLADLRRVEGTQRIALHGLGPDEVAEIMAAAAGHELDQDGIELAGQIAEETDGNPYFVAEILRSLRESDAIVFDETSGRWSVDRSASLALPESLREVIERRVERLGEQPREVLTLAALIGRSFDLAVLCAVADIPEDQLLDHLEAAVAASLLAESDEHVGEFKFAHGLVKQTLYSSLGATRRSRLHHRVAEVLEQFYGSDPDEHLTELALHWRLASVSVDRAKAVYYALRAGRQALARLAPAEALKLFADAVELMGDTDDTQRCVALIGLGEAQQQTGDPAYRDTLLEASGIASALERGDLAAAAALANRRPVSAGSRTFGEIDQERITAIERAIALDEPPEPARRARLLAWEAQELAWDPDLPRRVALAEEALTLARSAGDKPALAEVLGSASIGLWSPGTLELRSALAAELGALAGELRDPAIEHMAQSNTCDVCVERGELAKAKAAIERIRPIANELGQPALRWLSSYKAAGLELLRGHLAVGERLAEEAYQIGQEQYPGDALQVYGGQLLFIRRAQGRSNELIELQEKAVAEHRGFAIWEAGLAASLSLLDRVGEACSILDGAARDDFEHVGSFLTTLSTLVLYADAAAQTQHAKVAKALYARLEPFSEQTIWMAIMGYGHVRLWLGILAGLLEDHTRADEHLSFACQFHETNDMPLWAARGHLGWAEELAARGDADGAREHASRVLALSREHGYGAFEPRAAALLAAQPAAEA